MSNMEKHLFNLKFAAKELSRSAKKCDKEEKNQKGQNQKGYSEGQHGSGEDPRVDAVAARVRWP